MLVRLFLLLLVVLDSRARLCDGDEWWNWLAGRYILIDGFAVCCFVSCSFCFPSPNLVSLRITLSPSLFSPFLSPLSLLFPALPPATLDLNHHHYRLWEGYHY